MPVGECINGGLNGTLLASGIYVIVYVVQYRASGISHRSVAALQSLWRQVRAAVNRPIPPMPQYILPQSRKAEVSEGRRLG